MFYREIGRRVNSTAMKVMHVRRGCTEEGKGTRRRPTDQSRCTTECQDRHFRQLALGDSSNATNR